MLKDANTYDKAGQHKQYKKINGQIKETRDCSPTVPLLLSFEEVSRKAYLEKYGQHSLSNDPVTAVAESIARVELNQDIWQCRSLKTDDRLSIKVFCSIEYNAIIKSIDINVDSLLIVARIEEAEFGYLNLSIVKDKVLASINLAESNSIYLIKYNQSSASYYLFEAPFDKVEKPTRY